MANSKNNNEMKAALENFKMESANEVGVQLKQGYNGDLTSRQAGSIGGQMVKNVCHARNMKINFERADRNADGHSVRVGYIAKITV